MKKIILLINVILGFACTSTVEKLEPIASEKMVGILIGIHLLEGKIEKLYLSKDSSSMIFNTFQRQILEHQGVTKQQYEDSYQYYLTDVSQLAAIYAVVVDSLNVIQKRGYIDIPTMEVIDSISLIKGEKILGQQIISIDK